MKFKLIIKYGEQTNAQRGSVFVWPGASLARSYDLPSSPCWRLCGDTRRAGVAKKSPRRNQICGRAELPTVATAPRLVPRPSCRRLGVGADQPSALSYGAAETAPVLAFRPSCRRFVGDGDQPAAPGCCEVATAPVLVPRPSCLRLVVDGDQPAAPRFCAVTTAPALLPRPNGRRLA